MKKFSKIIIVLFLICVYLYACNICYIPNNIVIFEGDVLDFKTIYGLSLNRLKNLENENKETTIPSSISMGESNLEYKNDISKLNLELFGKFSLKTVNVNIISKTKVIPIGCTIGIKLYTNGVLVVGMSEIKGKNNIKEKPYENCGIEEGDTIIEIDDKEINSTIELINAINESDGNEVNVKYVRNGVNYETKIKPTDNGEEYKIGLWVRDAAAGIGTLTFYEPETNMFMSLGHGIEDIDTGKIVEISNGELVSANILSIIKGQRDNPGEIKGTITNSSVIGKIYNNTNLGVYGSITNKENIEFDTLNEVEVANRAEIEEGKASVICQLDNEEPKEYEIEIKKIYTQNNKDNKSMLIQITDEELIEKTGGIIQGMSGAPILQNGKFIGAVTNVFVKDPTQGYAIFGDMMIKEMNK